VNLTAFEEIVNNRRSTRKFAADITVPDDVIKKALELAILAPNSSNMQLWEFHWIKDPALQEKFHAICLNQSAAKTAKHLVAFVGRRDLWKSHAAWNLNLIKQTIGDKAPSKREKRGLDYYGILMPLVIPLVWNMGLTYGLEESMVNLLIFDSVSSVLAGAVFGDHCSPISDTTILSSMASQCDHIEHVQTQMPYALVVGGVSILAGIMVTVLGFNIWLIYALCIALLTGIVFYFGKRVESVIGDR